MTQLTALLDANVLYAAGLRDILLRLANQYLYIPPGVPGYMRNGFTIC